MTMPRLAAVGFIALLLAACGAPPPAAQTFLRDHVECPSVTYSQPQWSPDSASIFYLVYGHSTTDVHVMSRYGKDDQLLGQVQDALGPELSADHTRVLVQRENAQGIQTFDYFTYDLATTTYKLAAPLGDWASWSPDGAWFTYTSRVTAIPRIYKADPATGQTIPLTDKTADPHAYERYPHWSPDGKTIAFTSTDFTGRSTVTLIDTDGANRRTLAIDRKRSVCPAGVEDHGDQARAWLPRSDALLVAHGCGSDVTPWVVTLGGQEVADLSGLSDALYDQRWSPDETQIVYTTALGSAYPLKIVDSLGANARTLYPDAASPAWSPDGTQITFVGVDQGGFSEIFTIHPDGSDLAQLTANPAYGKLCLH